MSRPSKWERDQFVADMARLRAENPKSYRMLLGIMRAFYLETNPKPPRGKRAREIHNRIVAKVRSIDFRRAKALPGACAKVAAMATRGAA